MNSVLSGRAFRAPEAPSGPPSASDIALAVVLAIWAQIDVRWNLDNSTFYGPHAATVIVVAIATLVLAWRRTNPIATLAVVAGVIAAPELVTQWSITLWGHFVPLLVATYSAARWCNRRGAAIAAVVSPLATIVIMLRVPSVGTAANIPFSFVPLIVLFILGRALQARARHTAHLESHADEMVAAAIEEERNRIARELHDVVAHCVSVMVVQAGAAEELMERDPARARTSLRAVQDTGQQAIVELGRMLGLLRGGDDQSLTPQPRTDQLPDLAERMRDLGLPVSLVVTGQPRPLPPGLELTAYRIVQEALTNTLKHAGPSTRAEVTLDYRPGCLAIDIADDGHAQTGPSANGRGLAGMTERAAVFGGTISAGESPEGGFRVSAVLPTEAT